METSTPESAQRRDRRGYAGSMLISALGHVAVAVLAIFVVPRYFKTHFTPPPSYTVKIVDSIPAGDLGTHLPRLSQMAHKQQQQAERPPAEPPKIEPEIKPPPEDERGAIALNSIATPAPAPIATPTPTPTPAIVPTAEPEPSRTPAPKPVKSELKPTPRAKMAAEIAKATPTPGVKERLAKLKEKLLAEHLAAERKKAKEEDADDTETESASKQSGGGPVVASIASAGHGAGIGAGEGSAGVQSNLDFLLYYRTVQERIKKAWTFSGGNSDLATTVSFAIGADGELTQVKIAQSSNDAAYDDSVVRAIKRAAPFPAPPQQYRAQFGQGIEALFKLGELTS